MSIDNLIKDEILKYNQPDSDSPTLSLIDGRSIAVEKMSHNRTRVIFVKDKLDDTNQYIPSITSNRSEFHQIPDVSSKRDCLYICAPNQAGKTTYLAEYVKWFKKIYPKKKIYLFSSHAEDPILEKFNPIRIEIDEDLIENKISPEMLDNSFVIFDDIDKIRNKKVKKEVYEMIEEILVNGAHNHLNIAVTHHLMTNYKETRIILNESSSITFFPKGGSSQQIRYTLKNYYGLSLY